MCVMPDIFDEFIKMCKFTRINVQDDFINYEVGNSFFKDTYAIDHANKIIKEHSLPLKAEMIGFPFKHILHITSK